MTDDAKQQKSDNMDARLGQQVHNYTKTSFRHHPQPMARTDKHNVVKPVRTPVAILGSLGVCIYVPASRHWLISYSPIHLA